MSEHNDHNAHERLVHGYERMMERAKGILDQARKGTLPTMQHLIDEAKEKAVELGELTKDESEKIGQYLRRDLDDAAHYLSDTRKDLADWLRFDFELVEDRLMDSLRGMVDHTRLELDKLAARARQSEELHTGEVVGPGTVECVQCGRELNFQKSGHIPPCPGCHATVFQRRAR